MKIDGNELAILQNDLDRRGQKQEAWKIKQEFLKQVRESGDHCPCQEKCPHHGNCFECVTLHRGHRDHLPMCMWDMLNERIAALSHMTEGTLYEYEKKQAACTDCEGCPGCGERAKADHSKRSKVSPSSAFWRKTPSAHKESVVNQEEMCYLL